MVDLWCALAMLCRYKQQQQTFTLITDYQQGTYQGAIQNCQHFDLQTKQ